MVHDFIYRIGSTTNVIGRPPRFYNTSHLGSSGCRFASVYAVREEDARAIEGTAKTAAGFKGIVWSQRLWVDFDNQEAALKAQTFLKEQGYDHVVYSTGNRGCHIGITRAASPSHTLPFQDKQWAGGNLPGCDLSLYWHLHLIRLPGAMHETTGLPKRLLYKQTGRVLVLPPYSPSEEMQGHRSNPGGVSARKGSIFQIWSIVSRLTHNGGSRHDHLVKLAVALKEDGKLGFEEAQWILGEVNLGFDNPKEPTELTSILNWVYEQ